MKKILQIGVLLIIITITFSTYGQSWEQFKSERLAMMNYKYNFSNKEFRLPLKYDDTVFMELVDFSKTNIRDSALFRRTKFLFADFTKATFFDNALFNYAMFEEMVIFQSAHFKSKAIFGNEPKGFYKLLKFTTEFKSQADFSNCVFDSIADFRRAKFKFVNFAATIFHREAIFKQVEFEEKVKFKDSRFNSYTSFTDVKFGSNADFSGAQFLSGADFSGSKLPEYLNLSNIYVINKDIDLYSVYLAPGIESCKINLTGATTDKIKLNFQHFTLWPTDDSIEYDIRASLYNTLLEKQRNEGLVQSYEYLDKKYRVFQYTHPESKYYIRLESRYFTWINGDWLGRILNWIVKKWWGYGYDKERIVLNTFLIYLLLSLINTFWLKYLTTKVYANKNINELCESVKGQRWDIRVFNLFGFSLFYTAVIFFGLKFDMDKLNYEETLKGWKKIILAYFFFIYLGGFICLAYLANYIITV